MDSIKFTLSGKTMVRNVELLAAWIPLLVDLKIMRKHKSVSYKIEVVHIDLDHSKRLMSKIVKKIKVYVSILRTNNFMKHICSLEVINSDFNGNKVFQFTSSYQYMRHYTSKIWFIYLSNWNKRVYKRKKTTFSAWVKMEIIVQKNFIDPGHSNMECFMWILK
jgi:hypothetical protein